MMKANKIKALKRESDISFGSVVCAEKFRKETFFNPTIKLMLSMGCKLCDIAIK